MPLKGWNGTAIVRRDLLAWLSRCPGDRRRSPGPDRRAGDVSRGQAALVLQLQRHPGQLLARVHRRGARHRLSGEQERRQPDPLRRMALRYQLREHRFPAVRQSRSPYPWDGPGFPLPSDGRGIGSGALEVFGTYRGTLSFNHLSGTETFRVGPLRDLSLYVGGDANTKNTAFDPRQRDIVAGLQLAFDVPVYLDVAAAFYKEWNHNGIVPLLGNPPGMSEYVS